MNDDDADVPVILLAIFIWYRDDVVMTLGWARIVESSRVSLSVRKF